MDKRASYRKIVQDTLRNYVGGKSSTTTIRRELVIDTAHDHYQVMRTGWRGEDRIFGPSVHLDIIDGKIWIQHDGTDRPVAEALLEAGVPKEDIVLGFQPEHLRQYTGFAVS